MRKILSLALFAIGTSAVFAGGYRVSMQGNRQLAMGHTGVAVVNNSAEVLFFNPAGMSFLENKFYASAGANMLSATTKFQDVTYNIQAETKNIGTPFYAYAAYKVNNWLSAGMAIYSPYGSAVEWDRDWEGSHLVNNIDLKAIYFQPSIALKVADEFSFGGGPIFVMGGVKFDRNISRNITNADGERAHVQLDASGVTAWGWTAGFMFNLTEKIRLGMNYRSEITMEARGGDAKFRNLPDFMIASGYTPDAKFDADLPLPAELTAGISYEMNDKWLFAFDINLAKWSTYKALDVQFDNAAGLSHNPRNYKDAVTYRLGAQYKASEKFSFRAGWYFDESPVQDGYFAPETPRNDSNGYTAGLTYQITPKLGVDVSFLYLHFEEVDNSYNHYSEDGNTGIKFGGTYKNTVFSPGVGLSYTF